MCCNSSSEYYGECLQHLSFDLHLYRLFSKSFKENSVSEELCNPPHYQSVCGEVNGERNEC